MFSRLVRKEPEGALGLISISVRDVFFGASVKREDVFWMYEGL